VDAQTQQILWAMALEQYQAAKLTALQQWHNVSVACSYYAVYTAMWVALGDPPQGQWSHVGIQQHFAPGRWRTPAVPLSRTVTRAIRDLYNMRLEAHYHAVRLVAADSAEALRTAADILILVAAEGGFAYGGLVP
jgi:hypothetical protein